jgi:hypothetical protein
VSELTFTQHGVLAAEAAALTQQTVRWPEWRRIQATPIFWKLFYFQKSSRGPFLTSPLAPRGELHPQGWTLSPRGNVHLFVHPQGWIHSTVYKNGGESREFHPPGDKIHP